MRRIGIILPLRDFIGRLLMKAALVVYPKHSANDCAVVVMLTRAAAQAARDPWEDAMISIRVDEVAAVVETLDCVTTITPTR